MVVPFSIFERKNLFPSLVKSFDAKKLVLLSSQFGITSK